MKFLVFFHFVIILLIILDLLGLNVPIVRQIMGFIYITFLPGFILVRFLKLQNLKFIETMLYSIGLSLGFLMLIGFMINELYPIIGIPTPLSSNSIIATIIIFLLIMSALCYLISKKDLSESNYVDVFSIPLIQVLLLLSIPLLALYGTYLFNTYDYNKITMLFILVVAFFPILAFYKEFLDEKLYPLWIFVVAISLLYHTSLVSSHLLGLDIQYEHYLCNLAKINLIWDPMYPSVNVNGMLSVAILTTIYSSFLNMNVIWIYKLIYPLLYSIVPICICCIYEKQLNNKIALLASLFFMYNFTFFTELVTLPRQQVAEIFFALILLLLVVDNITIWKKKFLILFFTFGLSVSHYGVTYILLIIFIIFLLITHLNWIIKSPNVFETSIDIYYVFAFLVFALMWYMFVTNASIFGSMVNIFDSVVTTIYSDFLSISFAEGARIILKDQPTILYEIFKYIYLLSQLFIIVGVFYILKENNRYNLKSDYKLLAIISIIVCIAAICLPFFASAINTTRLYHILLFILAPFFVIGWEIASLKFGLWVFRSNQTKNLSMNALLAFMFIYLLFNTGFIFEVTRDYPMSVSLSSLRHSISYSNDEEDLAVKFYDQILQQYDQITQHHHNPIIIGEFKNVLCSSQEFEKTRSYSPTLHMYRINPIWIYKNPANSNTYIYNSYLKKLENRNKIYNNNLSIFV